MMAKKGGEEHQGGGFKGGHGDKGIQQACGTNTAAVATVKACIQKAHTSAHSGPDQEKTRFDNNCKAKAQCDQILGTCKAQLDEAKKALCECGQAAHEDSVSLRATTPSCKGLEAPKPRPGGQQGKQKACGDDSGKPDYCKEGFEKFQADRKAKGGKGRPGADGH